MKKKTKNNMPMYFSFIIFKQKYRNNYTTNIVTRMTSFLNRKYSALLTTKRQVPKTFGSKANTKMAKLSVNCLCLAALFSVTYNTLP